MTNTQTNTKSKSDQPVEQVSYAEKRKHLEDLLEKFDTGFLVTASQADAASGSYHARPMGLLHRDGNGDLWFATSLDSPKVSEIEADPQVLVTFQDARRFVAITGNVKLVRDRKKIEELWSASLQVWFDGKDDPNLLLLKVDAKEAAFWDNSGARGLKYLFQAAKALVTGDKPVEQNSEKDNAKLKL